MKKRSAGHGGRTVAAAAFKATCLQLMDRVKENGVEYVVTKHGKPVARLVPFDRLDAPEPFGCMKGTVRSYERPFDPVDADWDVNRD